MNRQKKCSKCKEIKSTDNFYKRDLNKDGLMSHCKQCQSKMQSLWREKNGKNYNKIQNERRKNNPYFHRENPCIYAIKDEKGEIIRVGSTSNTLKIRKTIYANRAHHTKTNSLVSIYLRGKYDNYKECLDNLKLIVLEELPKDCDKEYRLYREQLFQDEYDPILNERRAIPLDRFEKLIHIYGK